jgi:hypothetical protein
MIVCSTEFFRATATKAFMWDGKSLHIWNRESKDFVEYGELV